MKILEELWRGNIKPDEKNPSSDTKQHELVKQIIRHEDMLMTMLSDEARKTYEKLCKCRLELSSLKECEAFVSGFHLGANIILEVMEENNNG